MVLRDGRPCHVRPIRPDDAPRLVEFHSRLSAETIYFRFFAPYPELSDRDVKRFVNVDYTDRVALVATEGGELIAVARFDKLNPRDAEVAFVVRDDHQSRGLGAVLLEHLAAAAWEIGLRRFVAEVLPNNRKMLGTFREAGYVVSQRMEDGVFHLTFDLEPTDKVMDVRAAREHRSEARSVERLLNPVGVAVIGASRTPGRIGHELLRHLRDYGSQGPLYAIHPEADSILGVPAYRHITDIPQPVDLAVVAVPADSVLPVVAECAAAGVSGLVVVSSGFADTATDEGRARQRQLVRTARESGMRVVGPNCLGIINTDPRVSLNASLSPLVPGRGRVGLFCQSGALGVTVLETVARRGLGLSSFVSAGNRADVSANDLLQYWESDADDEPDPAVPGEHRQSPQVHEDHPAPEPHQAGRGGAQRSLHADPAPGPPRAPHHAATRRGRCRVRAERGDPDLVAGRAVRCRGDPGLPAAAAGGPGCCCRHLGGPGDPGCGRDRVSAHDRGLRASQPAPVGPG